MLSNSRDVVPCYCSHRREAAWAGGGDRISARRGEEGPRQWIIAARPHTKLGIKEEWGAELLRCYLVCLTVLFLNIYFMVRSFHGFHGCWCGLNPAHCCGPTSLICQLLSASCGDLVMRTTAAVSCLQRARRALNIVRGSQQLSALRTWRENLLGMTASSLSARAEV